MLNKGHVLIIDDDQRIRTLLSKYLTKNGYLIYAVETTKEARAAIEQNNFDLIILDVMLPGESGLSFAKVLRKTSAIAVLMLTAMGDVVDRIAGLEAGADDYLPKPFDPKELLLRIEKLISRTKKSNEMQIFFGSKKCDLQTKVLDCNNVKYILSANEVQFLLMLLNSPNKLVERDEIAKQLGNISPRSVDVMVKRLRDKLEDDPAKPIYIQTIRNKGYALFHG